MESQKMKQSSHMCRITEWLAKHKNIISISGLFLTGVFAVYGWKLGIFTSTAAMRTVLNKFGIFAPLIFIIVQMIQVVVPIIPASISCVFGVAFFGPVLGFVYNYLGICIGSLCAFLLGQSYGGVYVRKITGEKFYKKYSKYLNCSRGFEFIFTILIFLPVAPDDFLCYLAGVSSLSLKRFTVIILLGKPLALLIYSMGLQQVFHVLLGGIS